MRITGMAWSIFLTLLSGQVMAGQTIIASIKPVHSLVAGVMAGVGAPHLLVEGAASEHDYALRPSQARTLSEASLIFWIGPQLESFMIRPLANLAPEAAKVALSESDGVRLLPLRDAGTLQAPPQGAVKPPDDMHIWLDPENARAMVREIAAQLQAVDPANATAYAKNAAAMDVRLQAAANVIAARLAAASVPPYMVFHDAYHYFEARFGLSPAAIISLDPERPPGAGRLQKLRQAIKEDKIACVFAEPQFEPRLIQTLIEGTQAQTALLDPLGAGMPEGGEMYFTLLDRLANALAECKTAQ